MKSELWTATFRESLSDFGHRVGERLPEILAGLALLLVGVAVAWVGRFLAARLIGRVSRHVTNKALGTELRKSGVAEFLPKLVGAFVFWLILLFFMAVAGEIVGLAVVTGGVRSLAMFLPGVLAAALVIATGMVLGNLVHAAFISATTTADLAHRELFGRALRIVIFVVSGVVALDQLGIDGAVLHLVLYLAVGASLGGAALAFGLGARGVVANVLGLRYVLETYRVGQTIRIGEHRGRIVKFTSSGVLIDSTEGRVLVPGRDFARAASVLIGEAS